MRFILGLSIFLTALTSHAALTFEGASGVSGVDVTNKIIYGGMAGTCASTDGSNTCDSCTASTKTACNKKSIYPSLAVRLTFKTDRTGLNATSTYFTIRNSSVGTPVTKSVVVTSATSFSVSLTWAELCTAVGNNATCSGTADPTNFLQSIDMGLDTDNNNDPDATDKVSISVRISALPVTTYDVLTATCPLGAATTVGNSSSSNVGICDFEIFPGDQKIYVVDFRKGAYASDGTLTPAFTNFPQTAFVLFYQKVTTTAAAAFAAIGNNSEFKAFDMKITAEGPEINDNRASGFDNDSKYCFVLANQNAAGNIFYFTPDGTTPGLTEAANCGIPSPVVGVLDGKHCFIATAAFGGVWSEEVSTLRNFKKEFLLKTTWGRHFVEWYYSWSPEAATMIRDHELLREVVWVSLWPAVVMSKLFLTMGLWPAMLILIATLIISLFGFLFLSQRLIPKKSPIKKKWNSQNEN